MRIAILMCGQLRDIDFTIDSFKEYISSVSTDPNVIIDVFIATQDMNCIKPRIDSGTGYQIVNQYIVLPIKYDISEKMHKLLGKCVKGVNVRSLYEQYSKDQESDLILKKTLGWAENFKDLSIAIDMALDYQISENVKYDIFIKTRPDLIYCRPLNLESILDTPNTMYIYDKNDRFIWDTIFYMDQQCVQHMKEYYDFYMKFMNPIYKDKVTRWEHVYNCEDHLFLFAKLRKIQTIDIGKLGYPLSWLIADIKNNNPENKRYQDITNKKMLKKVLDYTSKSYTVVFDIKPSALT
jgi:hypothetical protein